MVNQSSRFFIKSFFYLISFFLATPLFSATAVPHSGDIYLVDIDAAIGPASSNHLQQSIRRAENNHAHLVVVRLNTPGGLASSMRQMTKTILSSRVPVAVYVSPSGSYAASAGAFLVYSAHIASMAPGTNIGAASPLPLGQDIPMPKEKTLSDATEPSTSESSVSTAQTKAVEDLTAYMRSLAELHQRNAKLGVEMITKGTSFTADEALQGGIIDFVSHDISQLLQQIHGKSIAMQSGTVVLDVLDRSIISVKPNWRYGFLKIITDPNITYLLLIAGIYGVLFELYSPGVLFPGILGSICLILSGYGLHLLPLNYAGLFLVILGIILIAAETFVTSYGILGIGGLTAFIVGSVFLLDTLYPIYNISKSLIAIVSVLTATLLSVIANFVFGSLRRPNMTGGSELIGKEAIVIADFSHSGQVQCEGAIYFAISQTPLTQNQRVVVTNVAGIRLTVQPKATQPH